MNSLIEIKYSKPFAAVATTLMVTFDVAINFIHTDHPVVIVVFNLIFGLLVMYCLFKFLLPAVYDKAALRLSDTGIYDFIRKQQTEWNNVSGIEKVYFGKGKCGLGVKLKDKEQFLATKRNFAWLMCKYNNFWYSTPFITPLQFLEGRDDDIVDIVSEYFKRLQPKMQAEI